MLCQANLSIAGTEREWGSLGEHLAVYVTQCSGQHLFTKHYGCTPVVQEQVRPRTLCKVCTGLVQSRGRKKEVMAAGPTFLISFGDKEKGRGDEGLKPFIPGP